MLPLHDEKKGSERQVMHLFQGHILLWRLSYQADGKLKSIIILTESPLFILNSFHSNDDLIMNLLVQNNFH